MTDQFSRRRCAPRTTSSSARCARAGSTSSSGRSASRSSSRSRSQASRAREEALDHVLLAARRASARRASRTSSARSSASASGVAGPALERKGDMAAILTAMEPRDVLFIDEIHRLNSAVEEMLYPALEDFRLDIIVGQGPAARTLTLDVPPFTLVGATTRTGLLTTPLRDRFGMTFRLEYYEPEELATIVRRSARILGVEMDEEAADEIARALPRHAAGGEPDPAARARRRRGAPRGRDHGGDRRGGARAARGRRAAGSSASTASSCGRSSRSSAAARSGSRRSPWRSARSRTRSRTSTSPICSSSASSSEPPAGES